MDLTGPFHPGTCMCWRGYVCMWRVGGRRGCISACGLCLRGTLLSKGTTQPHPHCRSPVGSLASLTCTANLSMKSVRGCPCPPVWAKELRNQAHWSRGIALEATYQRGHDVHLTLIKPGRCNPCLPQLPFRKPDLQCESACIT